MTSIEGMMMAMVIWHRMMMAIWQYGNMASDDDDYDGGGDDGDGNMTSDKWRAINWWKHRGAVEESSGAHIPLKYKIYTI